MKIYLFSLLLLTNTAFAQIWDYIITSNAGTLYYIEPASIVKKGEVVTYKQLLNYPNGYDIKNPEIRSVVQTKQIDCRGDASRTLSMIAYSQEEAKGNIETLLVGQETKWQKINQNSILSLYKNEVCQSDSN